MEHLSGRAKLGLAIRMETMKAAILLGKGRLEVRDVPVFKPRYDEFLLRVKACGVCGSDIRYFKGENPWSLHTLGYEQENPPNMILGHEFAGDIVAEGQPREPSRIGERVSVEPFRSCGECYYCRIGKHNICAEQEHHGHDHGWKGYEYAPGGMAEYTPAWRSHTYTLPDNISYDEATFLDGLAVAVRAIHLGSIGPGSELLIIGGGPIGMLIAQAGQEQGVGLSGMASPASLFNALPKVVRRAIPTVGGAWAASKLLGAPRRLRRTALGGALIYSALKGFMDSREK